MFWPRREKLGISQSAMIWAQKQRNVTSITQQKDLRKERTRMPDKWYPKLGKIRLLTPKEASLAINKNIRERTARRALRNIGYASATNLHYSNNVKARFKMAREHMDWTTDDWKRVLWPDESKFNRFQFSVVQAGLSGIRVRN